jgi:hypothetical protein
MDLRQRAELRSRQGDFNGFTTFLAKEKFSEQTHLLQNLQLTSV